MRILCLFFIVILAGVASASAAEPKGVNEKIYWAEDVTIENEFARDAEGRPITGTLQTFYPDGRLAWETQWTNGVLHGVTRGYYENRKLKQETLWIVGKLNGPAKWYDDKGALLRETIYENGKDLAAPEESGDAEKTGKRRKEERKRGRKGG